MAKTVGGWRMWLRIVCAAAFLVVAFAHRPIALPPTSSVLALAALVLLDGSTPVLCLRGDDDLNGGKIFLPHGCKACVIAASILLPTPVDMTGNRMCVETAVFKTTEPVVLHRRLSPPNRYPRPPPGELLV